MSYCFLYFFPRLSIQFFYMKVFFVSLLIFQLLRSSGQFVLVRVQMQFKDSEYFSK